MLEGIVIVASNKLVDHERDMGYFAIVILLMSIKMWCYSVAVNGQLNSDISV